MKLGKFAIQITLHLPETMGDYWVITCIGTDGYYETVGAGASWLAR